MAAAGALHFAAPRPYEQIVPRPLAGQAELAVAASGMVEMTAAVLLAVPRTRRAGAWLTFAVLLAVWPANFQMALDGGLPGGGPVTGSPAVAWLRVPLQVPLLLWAWRHTGPVSRSGR
ncbi:MAG: hypothetical protein AB1673_01765 [Actinomycetota bacterium]